jgi:hypothetical protein
MKLFKQITITPDQYKRITSITQLVLMLVLFVCGYSILFSVYGVVAQYILSTNLIGIANYMYFKLK